MDHLPPELIEALASVRSVGVVTGAGISAESGIQTYRGKGGLYDDPDEGERTVEALSGHTMVRDPDLTWRTVASLARQRRQATPNPGHFAIAAIEAAVDRFVLLTQNVDGLHQEAGSRNVIDIHGDIHQTVCMACSAGGPRGLPDRVERAPRCPACEGILRPDVVLFGEMLPSDKLQRIRDEFQTDAPDLVLVAGTSALFPYIVEPVLVAAAQARLTVEVDPEPTPLSKVVGYSLRSTAGEALPLIASAILATRS